MGKKIEQKYYYIAEDSIAELILALNRQNTYVGSKTPAFETVVQQILEPILAPGEYFAVCYDVAREEEVTITNPYNPVPRGTVPK